MRNRREKLKPQKNRCRFCRQETAIDYKDRELLSKFIDGRGKITPRGITGNCARHQRIVNREIKRARNLALLPFIR